jgi:uncharacterized HAD superfamily protein
MKQKQHKPEVIAVDVDGTLTMGVAWTPEECLIATPNIKFINWVNEKSKENFIVIWTSRRDHLIPATMQWLRKNGVMFHAISNLKMPADCYLEDKAKRPEEVI